MLVPSNVKHVLQRPIGTSGAVGTRACSTACAVMAHYNGPNTNQHIQDPEACGFADCVSAEIITTRTKPMPSERDHFDLLHIIIPSEIDGGTTLGILLCFPTYR